MEGSSKREAPASMESLPPDVLALVAEHFTRACSPLYDSSDILKQAGTLAMVGSPAAKALAEELFKFLSPRLGQALPGAVTQFSSAAQLKAALKEWELPTTGNKAALWQRLQDQVADNVPNQRSCRVSGAARAELSGWSQARVSLAAAKKTFHLYKSDVEKLPCGVHSTKGHLYLLSNVKALAIKRHGTWERLVAERKRSQEWSKEFNMEFKRKEQERTQAVQNVLVGRGWTVAAVQELRKAASSQAWCSAPFYGTKEHVSPEAAADHLEKMNFCVRGPASLAYALAWSNSSWEAEHIADEALAHWAGQQAGVEAMRLKPGVPRSLLPQLERLWAASRQGQAAR